MSTSVANARTRSKLDIHNQSEEVCALFDKEKEVWRKERLQSIKLLLETNKSYDEVAQIVGKAPSSVKKWAKAFRENGLSGLLERGNGGGRKGYLTSEVKEAIVEKLREGSFRTVK